MLSLLLWFSKFYKSIQSQRPFARIYDDINKIITRHIKFENSKNFPPEISFSWQYIEVQTTNDNGNILLGTQLTFYDFLTQGTLLHALNVL